MIRPDEGAHRAPTASNFDERVLVLLSLMYFH
jgi:hypothetical protein